MVYLLKDTELKDNKVDLPSIHSWYLRPYRPALIHKYHKPGLRY